MNTTTKTGQSVTLAIEGMTCGHCVQAVTKALSAVQGVKVRSVAIGTAVIEAGDGSAAAKAVAAVAEAGYPAKATVDEAPKKSGSCRGGGGGCCCGH